MSTNVSSTFRPVNSLNISLTLGELVQLCGQPHGPPDGLERHVPFGTVGLHPFGDECSLGIHIAFLRSLICDLSNSNAALMQNSGFLHHRSCPCKSTVCMVQNIGGRMTARFPARAMTVTLDPEQEEWLKGRVARGDFASVEEAARQLIDERIAELALEGRDDLAWAKPPLTRPWPRSRAARRSRSRSTRLAMRQGLLRFELRIPATTNKLVLGQTACGDVTRGGGIPSAAMWRYADRHD